MKKILALAVGMLLIPFTAFGMQMMSDSDMDSITGQSGVAVSIDNVQIYSASTDEMWFETTLAGQAGAAVGLVYGDESYSYLFINKIGDPLALMDGGDLNGGTGFGDQDAYELNSLGLDSSTANAKLRGDYTGLRDMWEDGNLRHLGARENASVLSIRVAQHNDAGVFSGNVDTARGMFAYFAENEITDPDETDVGEAQAYAQNPDNGWVGVGAYIEIGLPTLEIYSATGSVDELEIYVMGDGVYGAGTTPVGAGTDANYAYSLGTLWTSDSGATTAILGGRLGITSLGQIPGAYTSSSYEEELSE